MRIVRAALLAVLLLSVSFGLRPAQADEARIYIAAGDSIAAGIGASLPRTRGYVALVGDWMQRSGAGPLVVENVAIPGETAASFRTSGQLDAVVAAVAAAAEAGVSVAAVSLTLGGNEMLSLEPLGIVDRERGLAMFADDYREALTAMRAATGPETPIVVTTYYDLTAGDATVEHTDARWLAQFNEAIREAAQGAGAAVADIAPTFTGSIAEYTYYPFDVHPTNAGHAAIARVVAAALGISGTAPAIEVSSSLTAARRTPTLRFTIHSDFGVASLEVTSNDVSVQGPFALGDGEYAALIHFSDAGVGAADVAIVATDLLGAETTTNVTITLVTDEGGGR